MHCSSKQELPTPGQKHAKPYTSSGTFVFVHATKCKRSQPTAMNSTSVSKPARAERKPSRAIPKLPAESRESPYPTHCTWDTWDGQRGSVREKSSARCCSAEHRAGAEERQRGAGEPASAHVWGWEHNVAERLLSLYITDLMAFNSRLCKRSGIGTKGAGGIIILTRGAKEHGKIAC